MTVREACDCCEILRCVSPGVRAKVFCYGVLRKYRKGEIVFEDKEDVGRFIFLVEGYVALCKVNHNMDRKVIFVCQKGELLNEVMVGEEMASIGCTALSEVQTLSFSRKQFLEIMEEDFGFARMVMESMAKKIRRLYRQLGNTANMMKLERQVAAKLWKLGRDFGTDHGEFIQINFDLSITFLADMVGSKRESVSRTVKKFSERGIVKMEHNVCRIYQMEELKKIVQN